MNGVPKMRFWLGFAALLLPASVLAQANQPKPLVCPEGSLPKITNRDLGIKTCVPNQFVNGVDKLTAPAQLDELQAWRRHDDAMDEYDKHHFSYSDAKRKRDADQNRLDRKDCGTFKCNTQSLTSSIKSYESDMNKAYGRMSEAGRICAWHARDIQGARAREKQENLASVSLRGPSCPPGSQATGTQPVGGATASGDKCADVRAQAAATKGGARLALAGVSGEPQSVKMVARENQLDGAKFAPVKMKLVYSNARSCEAVGTVTAACAPPKGKGAWGIYMEPQCSLRDASGAFVPSLTLKADKGGLVTFDVLGFGTPGVVPLTLKHSGYPGLDDNTVSLRLTMLPK